MARGTCVLWNDDAGWGALRSPDLGHDVWCHFSNLEMNGYKTLEVGQPVDFDWIAVDQDGYRMRATSVRLLASSG